MAVHKSAQTLSAVSHAAVQRATRWDQMAGAVTVLPLTVVSEA